MQQIPQRILKLLCGEAPKQRAPGLSDSPRIGFMQAAVEQHQRVLVFPFGWTLAARLRRHFSCRDAVMHERPFLERFARTKVRRKCFEIEPSLLCGRVVAVETMLLQIATQVISSRT